MPFDGTLHEAIFRHGAARPDSPFVTVLRENETTRLRYGDLCRRSADFASAYARRGVKDGDGVAILLPQSAELYPAFVGAMAIGAIPAILPSYSTKQDPAIFWQVQSATLERMQAHVLVTEETTGRLLRQRCNVAHETLLSIDHVSNGVDARPAPREIAAERTAFLQHSSGTTALKKGVALSHGCVLRQIEAYSKAIGLLPADRVATWLPHYHDMGLVACFLLPAIAGIEVVCLDPFEWALRPASLLDAIDTYDCTLVWLPNFAFHHILRTLTERRTFDLTSMRAFIDCSEPCKIETLEQFHRALAGNGLRKEALQVCYALAENVFAVTQTPVGVQPRVLVVDRDRLATEGRAIAPDSSSAAIRLVSCGKPIETARVGIVAADGSLLPSGQVGEIVVGGETLFSGYYRAEDATASIQNGWYRTGDLGFLQDGELYVTGRAADVLIINGRNIYAHDLEQAINLHTPVKPGRSIALGVFDAEKGSEELVVVVETPDGAADPALRQKLADVVLSATGVTLSRVHFVEPGWLIKTTSGKLARRSNLEKLAASPPAPGADR